MVQEIIYILMGERGRKRAGAPGEINANKSTQNESYFNDIFSRWWVLSKIISIQNKVKSKLHIAHILTVPA